MQKKDYHVTESNLNREIQIAGLLCDTHLSSGLSGIPSSPVRSILVISSILSCADNKDERKR